MAKIGLGKRIARAVATAVLLGCVAGGGYVVHDLVAPSSTSDVPTHETPDRKPVPASDRFVKA